MDLKRSNPVSFGHTPSMGVPPTPFRPYSPKIPDFFWKITDLWLETNEFPHDPALKKVFLEVFFGTNGIVFNVLPFALLFMTVWVKNNELFQNFPFSLI